MSGNTATMVAVIAATRIKFDGVLHDPGDLFEMPDDDELARLVEGGAVKLTNATDGSNPDDDPPEMTVADAIIKLASLVADGDITEEAAYTQSDKPDCNALADIIGREVSAAERDEAVEQLAKENAGGNQG